MDIKKQKQIVFAYFFLKYPLVPAGKQLSYHSSKLVKRKAFVLVSLSSALPPHLET